MFKGGQEYFRIETHHLQKQIEKSYWLQRKHVFPMIWKVFSSLMCQNNEEREKNDREEKRKRKEYFNILLRKRIQSS